MTSTIGVACGPTLAAVSVRAIRTPDQRQRVFISSTLGELADERGAARLAALTHLAVLRRGTPEADAVHALRDVYDQFTEGFDVPQLVAARAALGG